MEIKKDFKNELFGRQELVFEIKSEKNPSFDEVKKNVSDKIGKPEENIYVRKILGSFGNNVFEAEVDVYDSKEGLDSIKRIERTSKERKEEIKARAEAAKAKAESVSKGEVFEDSDVSEEVVEEKTEVVEEKEEGLK